MIAEKMNQV